MGMESFTLQKVLALMLTLSFLGFNICATEMWSSYYCTSAVQFCSGGGMVMEELREGKRMIWLTETFYSTVIYILKFVDREKRASKITPSAIQPPISNL